jgi:MFS family permease
VKKLPGYRWFVVGVFFAFMLLHQADQLLIGPLTTPIMETFHINEVQMGAVFTVALVVATIFYPLWGYLYDRYARAKLLALASFIWGATTWLNAIAPTYGLFLATRATTGIDNSSYPGLYSLIADYFGPQLRGRVYGILQLTAPLGYLAGTILALSLRDVIGWRGVFYVTGGLGVIVAAFIFFGVREAPRGGSEPELAGLVEMGVYRFDWQVALQLFRKPSLLLLFAQGFFGVFPWNVITFWFFRYLETERGYTSDQVLVTMVVAVLVLAAGYFVGGAAGDWLFQRTLRGRLLASSAGVFLGAGLLWFTLGIPHEQQGLFLLMLSLTALFIPFASPNVLSTIYDITLPEVRSTVMAVESFIENLGAAAAPLLAGLIAVSSSLGNAILLICISTWLLCGAFLLAATYLVPRDIENLRAQLRARADQERQAPAQSRVSA